MKRVSDMLAALVVLAAIAWAAYSLVTADCLYPAGNSNCHKELLP